MGIRISSRDQAIIIDFVGVIDESAGKQYMQSRDWTQGLGEGKQSLILNFSGMSGIYTVGLTMLVRLAQCGDKGGYKTFGYGLSESYERLFRLLGMTRWIMLYPDEYTLMRRLDMLRVIS